ncbi:MAG: Coenzyme F420 hydrogenase/dehydrogenase, beta subunit C-terminal domain [Clostridia bacterium]|nr:Coenzyme F420 hydrogenase/dehydrogenase, beta subunit C-terminal domain [Clostridia bacterium]
MICKKEECTGCFSCYNICPKNAIDMIEDMYGFIYPRIDKSKCIDCGICKKSCPSYQKADYKYPRKCFAMHSKDEEIRNNSTSGGAATIFSEMILSKGGVVYGASFKKGVIIEHIRVEKKENLEQLKGSKYVHSYINNTFRLVKSDLENGRKVLFIGTPCQVAGLKSFLNKEYESLYLIDLVCHGVPSQKFLKDEIKNSLNVNFNEIDKIKFRGADGYKLEYYKDSDVIKTVKSENSAYCDSFMSGIFFRENCYDCPYAKAERVSDLTIGDFWGLKEESKLFKDRKKGISLILPITEKGLSLIELSKKDMVLEERKVEEAIEGNSQLQAPVVKSKEYDTFMKEYILKGYKKAYYKAKHKAIIKKNVKNNKLIMYVYSLIRKIIKK